MDGNKILFLRKVYSYMMTEPHILLYTDRIILWLIILDVVIHIHMTCILLLTGDFIKENVCAYIQMVEKNVFSVSNNKTIWKMHYKNVYKEGRVYKCKRLRLNNVDMLLNLWSSTRLIQVPLCLILIIFSIYLVREKRQTFSLEEKLWPT